MATEEDNRDPRHEGLRLETAIQGKPLTLSRFAQWSCKNQCSAEYSLCWIDPHNFPAYDWSNWVMAVNARRVGDGYFDFRV